MNFWSNLSLIGVYIFGANIMLAGIGSGFLLGEGMEEMFPFLLMNGFGQQSNRINPYPGPTFPTKPVAPVLPPVPATPPPVKPRPPTNSHHQTITWRWVPNVRYLWQVPGNNMKWNHPMMPMMPQISMPNMPQAPIPNMPQISMPNMPQIPMPNMPQAPIPNNPFLNPASNTIWNSQGSGNKV
ncbi:hypothetical protein SNE40_017336 [Patella caerulea]|uniref:Uncharacterized protein n=1 Tax=Patella caerulea TaxID=87958 RepID=A0AAN8JEU1_PATCE